MNPQDYQFDPQNPSLQLSLFQVQECQSNYYQNCLQYAIRFIKMNQTFTSEEMIDGYLSLPAEINPIPAEPRVWGTVIRELKRTNLIEHAGFGTYRKPEGHSKPVNVWKSLIFKG